MSASRTPEPAARRAGLLYACLVVVLIEAACDGSAPAKTEPTTKTETAPPRPPTATPGGPTATPNSPGPAGHEAPIPSLDPSTLPGAILFVSERDGDLEVYRWRAGAPLSRLTTDPRADFVAEAPADGRGFTRVVTTDGEVPEAHREQILWTPAEGDPLPIGPEGRRARSPSWSPDRSFMVFESDADGAFADVWRWDSGGTLTRLTRTEHGAFEPAVSPDGRRIAYVSSQDGNPELYVMMVDGTQPRRLTDWRRDDLSPRWSPDGRALAWLRREDGGERLYVLDDVDALPPLGRPLVATLPGERVKHADVAWSPDGRRLAYTVHRPDAAPHVAITERATASTRIVSPPTLRATMPSWSPDGRYLAFTATQGHPAALDVYAVALDDGAIAQLTDDPAPDWLPRWVAAPE